MMEYYNQGLSWNRKARFYKKRKKMRILFFLISLIVFAGFFISSIVYMLARAFGQLSMNPQSAAWKRMLEKLRARVNQKSSVILVPWDGEMLALLSTKRIKEKKPGFLDVYSEGVYTTIYQEPVMAFAGIKSGKTAILVARTTDREFIFRQKEKETEIWLNEQPFGLLVNGTLLAPGKGSKMLAQMELDPSEANFPVLMGDKTAAAIGNPALASGPNPRALTLLRAVSPDEENALLALAILKLTNA
jgi:hypothetical protein